MQGNLHRDFGLTGGGLCVASASLFVSMTCSMLKKFSQKRKLKKFLKFVSDIVIEDIATSGAETIQHLKDVGKMKNHEYEEALNTELTNFGFWLFQSFNKFPENYQKPILDTLYDTWFTRMRKLGADFELRKVMSDEINERIKIYNDAFRNGEDMAHVSVRFARFLSKTSKSDLDMTDAIIPAIMMENFMEKLSKYPDIANN
jgi:hypothetical protein